MTTDDQFNALQNAIRHYNLNVLLNFYYHVDKRKTVSKFYLTVKSNSISPVLNYNEMNCFIMGMGRAKQLLS